MAHVLKFGGSTFADLGDFNRVAAYLVTRLEGGEHGLAVVVSAMSGATERLRAQASALTGRPSAEAIDSLVPLADTISAALFRIALEVAGVTATVLVSHTLGFVTDSSFSHARLLRTDFGPLRSALEDHQVVLVPGGQAVDERGRQTWMGKNSSDLSAVAVAAAVGASRCEVFSDVDGVYTGDPNRLSGTRLLPALSWASARSLSERGAKVLHPEAVRVAAERGIELVCRSNRSPYGTGTVIGTEGHARAVVVDTRAVVATFDGADAADRAQTSLRADGVPSLRLPELGHVVVVPGGFFDLGEYLARRRLGGVIDDRCLLTVVGPGEVRSRLVARSSAVVEAQALHDRLVAAEGAVTRRAAPRGVRARPGATRWPRQVAGRPAASGGAT